MATVLELIDAEIAKLQQVRSLLSKITGVSTLVAKVGAPKERTKRNISPEGRKRIAEAVKRRWAAQKKASK